MSIVLFSKKILMTCHNHRGVEKYDLKNVWSLAPVFTENTRIMLVRIPNNASVNYYFLKFNSINQIVQTNNWWYHEKPGCVKFTFIIIQKYRLDKIMHQILVENRAE